MNYALARNCYPSSLKEGTHVFLGMTAVVLEARQTQPQKMVWKDTLLPESTVSRRRLFASAETLLYRSSTIFPKPGLHRDTSSIHWRYIWRYTQCGTEQTGCRNFHGTALSAAVVPTMPCQRQTELSRFKERLAFAHISRICWIKCLPCISINTVQHGDGNKEKLG